MKHRLLSISLALCMIISILPLSALAADYDGHWAKAYIEQAHERGWIVEEDDFRLDEPITRGEFAAMLWRALGSPAPKGACPFSDVPQDAVYRDAATALSEAGIVRGYGGGLFGPDDGLTREQGFALLARAFGLAADDAAAYRRFADWNSVSAWATEALAAMTERGYVEGVGNNLAAPQKALTRAEMAKLLVTVFDGVGAGSARPPEQPATAAPVITLTQSPTASTSGSVTVTVAVTAEGGLGFIGWRSSASGAGYSDKSGFSDITAQKQFSVSANGWYAACALDSAGGFAFKLIHITNITSAGGGGGGGSTASKVPTVTGVTVSPASVSVVKGATRQFTATVQGTNSPAQTVAWTVEGGTDSSISADGLLTVAADESAATLTVRATSTADSGKSGTATVTVEEAPVPVTGVTLDKAAATVNKTATVTLAATIAPANATNQNVSWASSDTSVATVSDGVVTGVAAGTATITVTTAEGGFTAACTVTVTAFAGGDGTELTPYLIDDLAGLQAIQGGLDKHYQLNDSIPISGAWTSIGTSVVNAFTGSLDGNGKTVTFNDITTDVVYAGLFGVIVGGTVQNLTVAGSLTGTTDSTSDPYLGGLAGANRGAIENCAVTATVMATGGMCVTGGLAGINDGTIANSYATGTVTAENTAGGLVGNNRGNIANCYATGNVASAIGSAGGLAGDNSGSIANCYATGKVESTSGSAGGLAGYNSGSIANCAALNGSVSGGTDRAGRVVGGGGTLTNNYANSAMTVTNPASGGTTDNASGIDGAGVALTDVKTEGWWKAVGRWNEDSPNAAWDFDTVWQMNATVSPYPILQGLDAAAQQFNAVAYLGLAGEGTSAIPYQLGSATELAYIPWIGLGKCYQLTDNITISSTWTPIGMSIVNAFTGSLDGDSYTVTFNDITTDVVYAGLFGYIDEAGKVKNLTVAGMLTSNFSDALLANIGGLAGVNSGTIENCAVTATVKATGARTDAGGLAGGNYGTITNSCASGAVTAINVTGGLAGGNYGSIANCYATGKVESTSGDAGGLAGGNYGSIANCYATGNVTSTSGSAGGLAGRNSDSGSIANCYATGKVESTSGSAGGLAGYNSDGGSIANCYATGNVSGGIYAGGLAGDSYGSIANCAALNGSVSGGTGRAGRVVGGGGTLTNNYANSAMTGDSWNNPGGNNRDGADVALTYVKTEGWWKAVGRWNEDSPNAAWDFTTPIWQWGTGAYTLPVLYWQTTMPVMPFSALAPLAAPFSQPTIEEEQQPPAEEEEEEEQPQTATLTVTATAGGTVTVDPPAPLQGGPLWDVEVGIGETVTITALPQQGYAFVEWRDESGETVSAQAEYSFAVTGDVTLTAVFAEQLTIDDEQ